MSLTTVRRRPAHLRARRVPPMQRAAHLRARQVLPTQRGEVARRLSVSASIQMVAKFGHVVLNIVSSLAIIHYLQPAVYGNYVLVIALGGTFGMLADFGINQLAVRQIALEEASENGVVGTVIGIRIALGIVAATIVQLFLVALGRSGEVRLAALFISMTFISNAVMAVTIGFHVRLRQHREALIILLGEFLETSTILVLIARRATLSDLTLATAVAGAIAAAVAIGSTRWIGVRPRFEPRLTWSIIRPALPLASAGLVGVVLLKLDCLFLAAMRSSRDVGIYGAAYQPVEYWLLAVIALITMTVPLLSRFAATDPERLSLLYGRASEGLVALALPVALLMDFLARPVIALAYPGRYAAAADPMRILALASVLLAASAWNALVLMSVGRQELISRYNLAALGVGLVVHPALIAAFGIMGAAIGTLTVGAVTAVTSTVLVHKVVGLRANLGRMLRLTGAVALASLVAVCGFAAGLGWWASAAAGVVVYLGAVWLLRLVDLRSLVLRLREQEVAGSFAVVSRVAS